MSVTQLVLSALAGAALVWLLLTFNALVRRRARVDEGWAMIEAELQRRHDLVPSLVAAVEGYLGQERAVMQRVADARAATQGASGAALAVAESRLTGALRSLLAVVEAYPNLRASEQVQALQAELATTEDRIAWARGYYNAAVNEYELSRRILPSALVAVLARFEPRAFFEADLEAAPVVSIDPGAPTRR